MSVAPKPATQFVMTIVACARSVSNQIEWVSDRSYIKELEKDLKERQRS